MRLRIIAQWTLVALLTTLSSTALAQDGSGEDDSEPAGPSIEEIKEKKDIDDKPRKMVRLYFDQKYPEGEAANQLAKNAIDGTEIVMERAENIARRQGQSLKGLREMHVYQRAASKAVEADKAPVAVYLSLRARGFAQDLVLANNEQFPEELEGTDAQDAKDAGGVTDEEAEAFVEKAESDVPTAKKLLEESEKK
jgi:HEPN domain-containing protein